MRRRAGSISASSRRCESRSDCSTGCGSRNAARSRTSAPSALRSCRSSWSSSRESRRTSFLRCSKPPARLGSSPCHDGTSRAIPFKIDARPGMLLADDPAGGLQMDAGFAPSEFPRVGDALLRKLDVPVPRYTSYPTAPVWTEAIGPHAYAQALARAGKNAAAPLSLYVHIPFCRERCSFCGCNVAIARSTATAEPYLASLAREMDSVAALLGGRRTLSQIHW